MNLCCLTDSPMFFRKKTVAGRTYLQIVESRRDGAKVRQQVVATLGKFDEVAASGQLERLLRSGARFAEQAMLIETARNDTTTANTRRIGPALLFERLWRETGCAEVVARLAARRKFEFPLERAVFLTVLHRLLGGGSDRATERWREDFRIDGIEGLNLHHLYRTMSWLGEELPETQQAGCTPFAPRCTKDLIEENLFSARRDLFSHLDLVFMDTTSLYFEGAGGETLGKRGFSKDHRPDLPQMILAVILDGDGTPVCCEIWPGNTADVTSLVPVIERLQKRFAIARVCVVADRGMISAATLAEIEARGLLFILGARERTDKLVRDLVLDDPDPFVPFRQKNKRKENAYEAKAVELAGRRYIVCRNEEEAEKDAADRAAILASLTKQLEHGDKALVGNKGFRRFLKTVGRDHFAIDAAKVEEDEKFDGIFVLRTNTKLNPIEAMLAYKQLWAVEAIFRTSKSLLATRPIFHQVDATIRGHVFCSFLALVLKKALEDRIAALGRTASWTEVLSDLQSLTETEIEQDGKRFLVRSSPRPAASLALRAVGIALPPTVRAIQA